MVQQEKSDLIEFRDRPRPLAIDWSVVAGGRLFSVAGPPNRIRGT